jgi:recombinational DNA repair ATPase RecF/rubrerythrin
VGERVTRVHMRAFRGVPRELTVDLPNGVSAVVLGENATGKSTLADALEWYLTGGIDFLRHEGREGAVRHVGAGDGVATSVEVETTGQLGGSHTIEGIVAPPVREAGRETFLLRGRTLTSFVESTKGEKWKALAELLGLEEVDQLRLDLQKVRNELRKAADAAVDEHQATTQALASKVDSVTEKGILQAISELCRKAEVAAPTTLNEALDPSWAASLVGPSEGSNAVQIAALESDLRTWSPPEIDGQTGERWNEVLELQTPVDRSRVLLLQSADAFLAKKPASGKCPLCGQRVDEEDLRRQVRDVLEGLRASAAEFDRASEDLRQTSDLTSNVVSQLAGFRGRAARLGIELQSPAESPAAGIHAALERQEAVDPQAMGSFSEEAMAWLRVARDKVETEVAPASTPREGTLVEIGVVVDQARRWRQRAASAEQARKASELADRVFKEYAKRQQAYFASILDRISGRVADIYAKLHPGEALADVCIEPWGQKGVELAVSFHGSRQKPPHGVLSESHLNSLAVALFLAMAETFNERLNFLVLDDVVNSFDVDHRGELAALLATEFTDHQIIVLTHDQLFFERLTKLAPAWRRIEFTSWDFEEGPRTTEYRTGQMLEKARLAMKAGDRMGAATKGRRALEELLQEICEGFAAPLPFRRGVKNDRREIGEVMKGVRRVLKDLSRATYDEVKPVLDLLEADVATALNPEAHASQVHPSAAEVNAALDRVERFDLRWSCKDCETRVWRRGTPEVCQCQCGRFRFPPAPG